jgi:hypothetical protein
MTELQQIPSKEAIEYGRRVIQKEVDRLKGFAHQASSKADIDVAVRMDVRWRALQQLLGDGGCVIAPFDERWLDDNFRDAIQATYNSLPVESE